MFVEARLEGYGVLWQSGREIIDAKVHLGQGDKSCNCSVTLADPTGKIAADLIEHSLESGGIQALPDSTRTSPSQPAMASPSYQGTPSNWATWEAAIVNECVRQGVNDKAQIAYVLATAQHESGSGQYLEEIASGEAYEGRSDLGNVNPGDGVRFKGRGLAQVTGRRNYQDWSQRLGVDLVGNPELASEPGNALTILVLGSRDGTFTGAKLSDYISGSNADFYNARRIINGTDRADLIAGYAQEYIGSGRLDQLLATSSTSTVSSTVPNQPLLTAAQASTPANFKGSKLLVTINDAQFTFYHQGTETNQDGVTVLTGQGIQWVLNRRPRNRTATDISLKQLAEEVSKAHGMQLEWLAEFEPKYTFIDQTGLSDYQLLLRECERCGLFLSESKQKLTVKSLRQIRDTQLVLSPGNNLITYQIKDQALDKTQTVPDRGSSLAQAEAKVDIDLITGQMTQVNPEVDPANSPQTLTGTPATAPSGTLAPGQDAVAAQARARTKRVKGLPSVFTVPLSQHTLALEPLDAIRTVGLPGSLSRIWMVDSVAHDVASATTKINAFSPVEVLDLSPSNPVVASGSAPASNPGGYIYPVKGFPVTDIRRWRSESRFHHGTDVGCPEGSPIYASASGTVVDSYYEEGGYGNVIYLKHPDGYESRYAHLSQFLVNVGDTVQQGQQIALSGNTGIGTGAHLHVEWRDPSGNSHSPEDVGLAATVGQVW